MNLFKVILYYALVKGAREGLKRRRVRTLKDFDLLMKQLYVDPIMEHLNRSIDAIWFQQETQGYGP